MSAFIAKFCGAIARMPSLKLNILAHFGGSR